jgi:hypothetical protein
MLGRLAIEDPYSVYFELLAEKNSIKKSNQMTCLVSMSVCWYIDSTSGVGCIREGILMVLAKKE